VDRARRLTASHDEPAVRSECEGAVVRPRLVLAVVDRGRRRGRLASRVDLEIPGPARLGHGHVQHDRVGTGRDPALASHEERSARVRSQRRAAVGACRGTGVHHPAGRKGVKALLRGLSGPQVLDPHGQEDRESGKQFCGEELRPVATLGRSSTEIVQFCTRLKSYLCKSETPAPEGRNYLSQWSYRVCDRAPAVKKARSIRSASDKVVAGPGAASERFRAAEEEPGLEGQRGDRKPRKGTSLELWAGGPGDRSLG
jgi:hypothetical protein